ncbi:hypothetical protein [Enterovirga rhinocerotis]|uniref:Uncharacterized protein n=1 Tax=Enterovirga rhinocerotis TaxID=1339210 RepID=A0A4R7C1G4_9HYPH|nr:hypothetical protein [Enterovirga rhinocerotis]TDR90347.1 hypothetical protein EV668_3198 [Enterovirga rhinocerotis]
MTTKPNELVDEIERIAQWLHDEVVYPDPSFPHYSWPEHEDDTGQRGDGWLRMVPRDTQEQFRDIARRFYRGFVAPARLSPDAPVGSKDEPSVAMLQAGYTAYARKEADVCSVTPSERPDEGGGPLGYAYMAMRRLDPAFAAPAGETAPDPVAADGIVERLREAARAYRDAGIGIEPDIEAAGRCEEAADLIERHPADLARARAEGRREMAEEAAKVAESHFCFAAPNIVGRIAAAIRSLAEKNNG